MAHRKGLVGMLAAALMFSMFLMSCATRIGDFTLMSSKNVDLSRINEFQRSGKTVKGTDSIVTVLFFIPVKKTVDLKKALDNALSKIPGSQALVDVRFDNRKLNFLLFQIDSFVVSGTVLIDPRVVDASETSSEKPYLVMDTKDGEHFTKRYVGEDEYQSLLAQVQN